MVLIGDDVPPGGIGCGVCIEDAEEYFTFVSVRPGGITLASRLLGHVSEAGTHANYVATPEQIDPGTAVIRDGAIGRAKD